MDELHYHRCPDCKTVWKHSDRSSGSDEAHTCPECGVCKHSWHSEAGIKGTFYRYEKEDLTRAELESARILEAA